MSRGSSSAKLKPVPVANPESLSDLPMPATAPAAVAPEEDATFGDGFDKDFHDLLGMHFEEHERELRAKHAAAVVGLAEKLVRVRQRVTAYLGLLADAVETYHIYRYVEEVELTSPEAFWDYVKMPREAVRQALQLHRNTIPIAEQVGVPLRLVAKDGQLTGAQTNAVNKVARKAKAEGKLETEEGRAEVREVMQNIIHQASDTDLYAYMREVEGKPDKVRLELVGEIAAKPEPTGPLMFLHGEASAEHLKAVMTRNLEIVLLINGQRVTFRQASDLPDVSAVPDLPALPAPEDEDDGDLDL